MTSSPSEQRFVLDQIIDQRISPAAVARRSAQVAPEAAELWRGRGLNDDAYGVHIVCNFIDGVFQGPVSEDWWVSALTRLAVTNRQSAFEDRVAWTSVQNHLVKRGVAEGWREPDLTPLNEAPAPVSTPDSRDGVRAAETLHTAMTSYFIGVILLLCGVGLFLIPIDPPETAHAAGGWLLAGAVATLIFGAVKHSASNRLFDESRRK